MVGPAGSRAFAEKMLTILGGGKRDEPGSDLVIRCDADEWKSAIDCAMFLLERTR
jgi:hypothetical protein